MKKICKIQEVDLHTCITVIILNHEYKLPSSTVARGSGNSGTAERRERISRAHISTRLTASTETCVE